MRLELKSKVSRIDQLTVTLVFFTGYDLSDVSAISLIILGITEAILTRLLFGNTYSVI